MKAAPDSQSTDPVLSPEIRRSRSGPAHGHAPDPYRREAARPTLDPADRSADEKRLDGWLLSDTVQRSEGEQRGAVVGWFDERQDSRFVYAEATGYYLTYLSYCHDLSVDGSGMTAQALDAGRWMERTWASECMPPTRAYLDGQHQRDWRNEYHFSFDLGMMLRGAAQAARRSGDPSFERAARAIGERLLRFVGPDGRLLPCRSVRSEPQARSWSVEPGPYQMKTAACILAALPHLPKSVQEAAEATWEHWRSVTLEAPSEERLHNFLYSIEGLVLEGLRRRDVGALDRARFALDTGAAALGLEPFEPARVAMGRSDVAAQTLRLALILHGPGSRRGEIWTPRLDALAATVAEFIDPDGTMHFRRNAHGRLEHANAWSGMFASQALRFYRIWRSGSAIPDALVSMLV